MKILIVGLGSIAKKHIDAIRQVCPHVEIYALRSTRNAIPYSGVIDIYEPDERLKEFKFAIISNPTSLHARTISDLLKYRIPLFIEKPVVDSLEYSELINEVKNLEIPTYVACNLRFLGCLRFIKDHLRKNPSHRINEVNVYCGSYLPDWRPGLDYKKCYSAIPELGGGVNIDLIHELDFTCWIFGWPKSTFAICRNVSSLDIRAFDYANYTLIYPDFTVSVVLNYYRRDYKRTIEIVFEDETWSVDLKSNTVIANGIEIFRGNDGILDTYRSQMEYFLHCLNTGELIENDIESAYKTLNICLNYERLEK